MSDQIAAREPSQRVVLLTALLDRAPAAQGSSSTCRQ
jgi:hypothetical protein